MTSMTLEKTFIIEDRNKYINRIDILSKIKPITSLLPDGESMTIKAAAKYYEVERSVVERCLNRHKEEFEQDGVRTITKRDSKFELYVPSLSIGQHTVKLVTRRALLRLGMLLTISNVAILVRDYLSNLDALTENEEPKTTKRERNRNHSAYYMEHRGNPQINNLNLNQQEDKDNITNQIHSNNDELVNGLIVQLEQFKVNTGIVNDLTSRIKELEYELKIKTILFDEQEKIVAAQDKAIYRLKRDNKSLKTDLKGIQKIVFKSLADNNEPVLSDDKSESKTYGREAHSGLVINN